MHYDLIVNLHLEPFFCGHFTEKQIREVSIIDSLKIANDLPSLNLIMHLLLFLSPYDWISFCHMIISLDINSLGFLFILCFSLTNAETFYARNVRL